MGLDAVEILMDVERDFGTRIPDDESETLLTMQDLCDSIVRHLLEDDDQLPQRLQSVVYCHLKTIVAEQMGIKKSHINPDSNFVKDLGVT